MKLDCEEIIKKANELKWAFLIGFILMATTTLYFAAIQAKLQGFALAAQILISITIILVYLLAFVKLNKTKTTEKSLLEKLMPYAFATVLVLLLIGFADYSFNIWTTYEKQCIGTICSVIENKSFFADIFPNVFDSVITGIVIGWFLQEYFEKQKTSALKPNLHEFYAKCGISMNELLQNGLLRQNKQNVLVFDPTKIDKTNLSKLIKIVNNLDAYLKDIENIQLPEKQAVERRQLINWIKSLKRISKPKDDYKLYTGEAEALFDQINQIIQERVDQ